MLYYIAWLLLQPWRWFFLHAEGLENIPKEKCRILVIASHNGELDPWRIGIYLPLSIAIHWFAKVEFFTKEGMAKEFSDEAEKSDNAGSDNAVRNFLRRFISKHPAFFSWIVRNSKAIPVNKNDEKDPINITAVKKAIRLLKQNELVGIFPRAKIGEKKYVNANFIGLALKTDALILPVNVNGRRIVFGRSFKIEDCSKNRCLGLAQDIMKKIEAL